MPLTGNERLASRAGTIRPSAITSPLAAVTGGISEGVLSSTVAESDLRWLLKIKKAATAKTAMTTTMIIMRRGVTTSSNKTSHPLTARISYLSTSMSTAAVMPQRRGKSVTSSRRMVTT